MTDCTQKGINGDKEAVGEKHKSDENTQRNL